MTDIIWIGNTLYPRWIMFLPLCLPILAACLAAVWPLNFKRRS